MPFVCVSAPLQGTPSADVGALQPAAKHKAAKVHPARPYLETGASIELLFYPKVNTTLLLMLVSPLGSGHAVYALAIAYSTALVLAGVTFTASCLQVVCQVYEQTT